MASLSERKRTYRGTKDELQAELRPLHHFKHAKKVAIGVEGISGGRAASQTFSLYGLY